MTPDPRLRQLRADWETLGRADPLWAVYVRDDGRDGGWDRDELLATGEREVADSWQRLTELGLDMESPSVVLDFGCGVGRLTSALATRADRVVGLDISAAMLATARSVIPPPDRPRVLLVLSDAPDLPLRSECVDLVYTSLVLQHMPKALALRYVSEFLRVLVPGGIAVIQVAESPTLSWKGLAFRVLPASAYGWLQRRVLGYPAPMRMEKTGLRQIARVARARGGEVVTSWRDDSYGGHWRYRRIVVRRRA